MAIVSVWSSSLYPENSISMSPIFNVLGKDAISIAGEGGSVFSGGLETQPADNTIIKHEIIRKDSEVFIDE